VTPEELVHPRIVLDCAFRDPSGNMVRIGQTLVATAG
jgi:hypothetical protein